MLTMSLLFSLNAASSEPAYSKKTVLEWMTMVVVPNSDILWNVDDPRTAAEWQVLENAAARIIEASVAIEKEARGPEGRLWSNETAWKELNSQMKQAAIQAKAASEARDLDKLLDAGDVLYPPCESCHLKYNPGVVQQ